MGKFIVCWIAWGAWAQAQTPVVVGVVNDLWSSPAISPGSPGYVLGSGFGTPLDTTVTVGGLPARVLAVSPGQVRALFPSNLPAGPETLSVTVDGKISNAVDIVVSPSAPRRMSAGRGSMSAGLRREGVLPEPHPAPRTSASGSGIVFTCDPTIYAMSATACDTLNTTIAALYSNAFTNANANIYIQAGQTSAGESEWEYGQFAYATVRNALIANDPTAALPVTNPYPTVAVGVVAALMRALGIADPCRGAAGCYDGTIIVSSSLPWYFRNGPIPFDHYDFFSVVEHETDEVLGTASCVFGCGSDSFFPPDYFRYHSDGTRSFTPGTNNPCSSPDATNACFSLDGVHMLQQYNAIDDGEDAGDWATNCAAPLVQNAEICNGDGGVDISPAAEVLVLGSIGYTLRNPSLSGGATNVTSATPNGAYRAGESILIQIVFSEPVTVAGTPQLALNSGGAAFYNSGSGTSTLIFAYQLAAGQSSTLLDVTSTGALTLNGGSIGGPSGAPENLTLPRPGVPGSLSQNADIVIGTTPAHLPDQPDRPKAPGFPRRDR